MAVGALGAGALPVPNPLFGMRLLGLPARNATLAIALTYAGMALLIVAWAGVALLLRRVGAAASGLTVAGLTRIAVTWAVPLLLAPPLFSRDIYSYLAQSAMVGRGFDPYALGPAAALGVDDPLVRSIPTLWRDTPAPYGPLFLLVGRGFAALTGDDAGLGIAAHRLLALAGLALVFWALPRLARRAGVDAGRALWLGAANPLMVFHVVSGAHNEAVMVGLVLAGLEIGMRAGERALDPRLLAGGMLIVAASAVKLPALLALGFLGMEWARRRGGRTGDVAIAAGVLGAVTAVVYTVLSTGTGVGWGWIDVLYVPGLTLSWLSASTVLGMVGGWIGVLGGLGDHGASVVALGRGAGLVAAAAVCGWLLLSTLRGRLDPVAGVAAGMAAVVLLGPAAQPWYLLWAVVPSAATTALPRFRKALLAGSTVVAVVVAPAGADFAFHAYQLPTALGAAIVIIVAVLWARFRRWPHRTDVDDGAVAVRSGAG